MGNKIKIAIAGLGNCASSIIQGVEYYKDAKPDHIVPGLMHVDFGGYHVGDIEWVAAFDVNRHKIGRDISVAIWKNPNCSIKFTDVPLTGVKVLPGPISDGVADHMKKSFFCYNPQEIEPVDVTEILREVDADMLVNYLPVGSYEGSRIYAKACIEAGVAFVNGIPEFIASDLEWSKMFEEKEIPIAGDDIKSQLGATIMHRTLAKLCLDRGVQIDEMYQLNLGGNTDFENMTVESRLTSKRVSKTEAVTSLLPYEVPTRIGPSDYVPFLEDKKICYVWIKGRKFGDAPVTVEAKLSVEDSPNSGGVMIDVFRAVKLAMDRGIAGQLTSISAYAFKHPPIQVPDFEARKMVEEFIQGVRER